MKALKIIICLFALCALADCKKSDPPASNASMTASVNGNPVSSFTGSISMSNGFTVFQGTSSLYTIQIWLKIYGAGTYVLGDPNLGYYATVQDNFGTLYTTNAVNDMGSVSLTAVSGGPNLYNGTFYFTAASASSSINVTSGTLTNF